MTGAAQDAFQKALPKMTGKRAQVYDKIVDGASPLFPGMTLDDLCASLGWKGSTTSARITELADYGFIKEYGVKRNGQTVWIPSAEGEAAELRRARLAEKSGFKAKIVSVERANSVGFVKVIVLIPENEWPRVKREDDGLAVRLR